MFTSNRHTVFPLGFFLVLVILGLTGCQTSTIPLSVTVPGEFNLTGVSKIAIAGFDSLPDDPLNGVYSADKATLSIVRGMVASAFYKDKRMYQIADLDIENEISQSNTNSRVDQKYDAVLYGHLWWQISPEYLGKYPGTYQLDTWQNVKYTIRETDSDGKVHSYSRTKKIVTRSQEVAATKYYRSRQAWLMLSLSLYRVDKDGKLEKITETHAAAGETYLIDNGIISGKIVEPNRTDGISRADQIKSIMDEKNAAHDRAEVTKESVLVKNTKTIPTDLQFKLSLVERLSQELSQKISPFTVTFEIPNNFDDELFLLLRDGAYNAAQDHIVYTIRKKVGNKIADRIAPLQPYESPSYLVPGENPDEITDKKVTKAAKKYIDYLYGLAICEEASGRYDQALETYRYIFDLEEDEDYSKGISRCLFAIGMNNRLKEKEKAKNAASERANIK